MRITILRGLPGCGKSTYVDGWKRSLGEKVAGVSADNFHITNGKYIFDPKNIGLAHNYCLDMYLKILIEETQNRDTYEAVYVDNTNLSAWEIAPYYRLAEVYGFPVTILTILCSVEQAYVRNVHGVPLDQIWKMYQKFLKEELPPHWKQEFGLAKSKSF